MPSGIPIPALLASMTSQLKPNVSGADANDISFFLYCDKPQVTDFATREFLAGNCGLFDLCIVGTLNSRGSLLQRKVHHGLAPYHNRPNTGKTLP